MKSFSVILLLFFSFNLFAQKTDKVLATANGQNYTVQDLAPENKQALENLPKIIKERRADLLEQQIRDLLLEKESAARKMTAEKLVETEVAARTSAPTEAEIKAVYEANRASVGNQTLEQVRPQIVAFLRRAAEQKAFDEFLSNLKIKYKVALGKDVNAADLSRFENLAIVGGEQISVGKFETVNKKTLAALAADADAFTLDALEEIVYSNLIVAEAKAQNIGAGDLIAREISNKLKSFSDAETAALESALREKLFAKYNAKFFVKETPQAIASDNQPSKGTATAPVTVVMFTDFQCPACAAVYPLLQEVLAGSGDKARFVVRDFPLVQIHANAFRAAEAASAAHAQGKFFEYTEILYRNQDNLDDKSLAAYAAQAGLDAKRFAADLASGKFAAEIKKDIADGAALGLSSTPTVFVNGVKVRTLAAKNFRQAIDRALRK